MYKVVLMNEIMHGAIWIYGEDGIPTYYELIDEDEYFKTISAADKHYIVNKILNDVKGKMLEEIVLLEVKKSLSKSKEVFKFKFMTGGKFDMVIFDMEKSKSEIYEIKHSDK